MSSIRISHWRRASRNRARRGLRLAAIALFITCGARSLEAARVWIDTDVSIGSPFREVDDAYALVLALHSRELEIAGVSASYGNAPVKRTTRIARDLLSRFGRSAGLNSNDVSAGARSAKDLGSETPATRALVSKLRPRQKLTYIALGPLTNLATILILRPELAQRIERVVFVGGKSEGVALRFGAKGFLHIHDANVFKDPAAMARVLASKIPLSLIPIETSSRLVLDGTALKELEGSGSAGRYLSPHSRVWLWFWTRVVGERGGPIFDALAVAGAIRPELLRTETRYATIDASGNLIAARRPGKIPRPVRFCKSFTAQTNGWVRQRLRNAH